MKTDLIGSIFTEKLKIVISNYRTTPEKREIGLEGPLNSVFEGVKIKKTPKLRV